MQSLTPHNALRLVTHGAIVHEAEKYDCKICQKRASEGKELIEIEPNLFKWVTKSDARRIKELQTASEETPQTPPPAEDESDPSAQVFTKEEVDTYLEEQKEAIAQEAYDKLLNEMMRIYNAGTFEGRPYFTYSELNKLIGRFGSKEVQEIKIQA